MATGADQTGHAHQPGNPLTAVPLAGGTLFTVLALLSGDLEPTAVADVVRSLCGTCLRTRLWRMGGEGEDVYFVGRNSGHDLIVEVLDLHGPDAEVTREAEQAAELQGALDVRFR